MRKTLLGVGPGSAIPKLEGMPQNISQITNWSSFRVPSQTTQGKWRWGGKEIKVACPLTSFHNAALRYLSHAALRIARRKLQAFDGEEQPTLVKFEALVGTFKPQAEEGLNEPVGALKTSAFRELPLPRQPVNGERFFERGDVLEICERPIAATDPQEAGEVAHLLSVTTDVSDGESAHLIPARLRKAKRFPGVGRDSKIYLANWPEEINSKAPLVIEGPAQLANFNVTRWWREQRDSECVVHLKVGRERATSCAVGMEVAATMFPQQGLDATNGCRSDVGVVCLQGGAAPLLPGESDVANTLPADVQPALVDPMPGMQLFPGPPASTRQAFAPEPALLQSRALTARPVQVPAPNLMRASCLASSQPLPARDSAGAASPDFFAVLAELRTDVMTKLDEWGSRVLGAINLLSEQLAGHMSAKQPHANQPRSGGKRPRSE